ncbi:MAG: hypothetical protein LBV58_02060 [Acholeplasmatales bacterium]|jgi:hypothetical protein|nr:hypothetical protein [Acholeplasmatales bacterium]
MNDFQLALLVFGGALILIAIIASFLYILKTFPGPEPYKEVSITKEGKILIKKTETENKKKSLELASNDNLSKKVVTKKEINAEELKESGDKFPVNNLDFSVISEETKLNSDIIESPEITNEQNETNDSLFLNLSEDESSYNDLVNSILEIKKDLKNLTFLEESETNLVIKLSDLDFETRLLYDLVLKKEWSKLMNTKLKFELNDLTLRKERVELGFKIIEIILQENNTVLEGE